MLILDARPRAPFAHEAQVVAHNPCGPFDLSIAATAVGLRESEFDILRRCLPWSIVLMAAFCLLVGLQPTPVLSWMLP